MKYNCIIFLIINLIGAISILYINPIIGSIILICAGLITFSFPKTIQNFKNNESMFEFKIGSLFIFLCGISTFAYFIGIIPPIIFDYISKEGLFLTWVHLFFIGFAFMIGYNESKLEMGKYSAIRNKMELFIYVLINMSLFSFVFYLFIANTFLYEYESTNIPSYLLFFSGFLIIICPNALDTKRSKYSSLFTRIYGIMFIFGSIIFYILIIFYIPFIIELILIGVVISIISIGLSIL